MENKVSLKSKQAILLFASYLFLYMCTSTQLTVSRVQDISLEMHQFLYYASQGCFFLGFLGYGIFYGKSKKFIRTPWLMVLAVSYGAGALVCSVTSNIAAFGIASLWMAFAVGTCGGASHHCTSFLLLGEEWRPLYLGIAGAIAILVQYVLQIALPLGNGIYVLSVAAFAGIAVYYGRSGRGVLPGDLFPTGKLKGETEEIRGAEFSYENSQTHNLMRAETDVTRRHLLFLCLTVVAMAALLQFYDNWIGRLQFLNGFDDVTVYGWQRLSILAVYLLVGWLSCGKRRRYLPVLILLLFLLAVLFPALVTTPMLFSATMILFYLMVGVTVAYYNIVFIEAAPHMGNSGLWASMGRMLDFAVGVVFGAFTLSALPMLVLLVIQLLFLAAMLLCMVMDNSLGFAPERTDAAVVVDADGGNASSGEPPAEKKNVEERAREFAAEYGMTSRETDVFLLLVTTDDIGDALAERLSISRRQLQKHIASIYEKTDTGSRMGLLQKFFQ